MAPKPEPVIVPLKLSISFTDPSQLAKWDIGTLNHDQSLIPIATFGGPPSPETLAENARRAAEYSRRYIAIIKKYEVEEEYIAPLIAKRNRLWAELVKVQEDIERIRS